MVAFSSSSVLSKADSNDRSERRLMRSLAAGEEALVAACSERGISLLLLRPTMIYGCGMDRNVSRLAAMARRHGVIPLAGAASGLRQPVHAEDLAAGRHVPEQESPAAAGIRFSYDFGRHLNFLP